MLSQKATINPVSKTVTLDEAKTIDVAKIIKNESRLKSLNDSLIEIVRLQNEKLIKVARNNLSQIEKIEILNKALENLSESYDRLSTIQLDYEKQKTKPHHFFGKARVDYLGVDGRIIPSAGVLYLNKRFGIGSSLGFFEGKPVYGFEVMLSFF